MSTSKNIRLIAKLEVKGPNVVKPVHIEALRVVGTPTGLAEKYYRQNADEIIYLDIVASLYQRTLDLELLKATAEKIFVPLTVGGGIRSLQDINNALKSGADKVAINTYAVNNPDFLKKAVKKFGSQCIVLYIESKRTAADCWEAYTDGGRERTNIDVIDWAKRAIDLGVGEILATCIDQDGTKRGFELSLIKKINSFSPVPLIAAGGAGDLASIKQAIIEGEADAIALSSILHFNDFSIPEIKEYLSQNDIKVRKTE